MSRSSSSCRVSASSLRLVKMPAMSCDSLAEVLVRPALRRWNQPCSGAGSGGASDWHGRRIGRSLGNRSVGRHIVGYGSVGRRLRAAAERAEETTGFCRLVGHATHMVASSSPRNRLPVDPVTRASTSVPGAAGASSSSSAKPGVRPSRSRSISSSTLRAHLSVEVVGERCLAPPPQACRPLLHDRARHLRHARGRRALARREREDVQEGQPAVVDEAERVGEHRLGLGGEARDQVGAEHDVRPQAPRLGAEADRIRAEMPALHALEDHVVAGLHRQMQVRHQARLVGDRRHQVRIRLDLVDRRQPQARQLRHMLAGCAAPACRASSRPADRRRRR